MQHLPRGGARWYLAAGESVIAAGNLGDLDRVLAVVQAFREESPGADSRISWSSGGPRSAETRANEARAIAMARAATQLLFAGRRELAGALLAQIDEQADRGARSGGDGERRSPTHSGDFAVAARVQSARAWQAMVEGAPERHLRLSEAAAASFEQAGDLRNACRERVIVGSAYLELGAHAEAERALEGALAGAQRMGLPTVTAAANSTLGIALARQGRFGEALAVERAAVDAFRRHGGARMEITSRANLAKIYAACGDLESAEREARAAVAVAEAVLLPTRAVALAVLSSALLDRGRVAEALSAAQEATRAGASPRTPQAGDALVALVHAKALRASGDEAGGSVVIAAARERLLTRAATIEDPKLRASFLEQVPENIATMALGGPSPPACS
jgi:tetratricopeptide (TPR) repeat protein